MAHWVLTYDLAADYFERRPEHRGLHLKLAWEASDRGELLLGGALGDQADQAMLLFEANGPEVAEAFARADPYVVNGLVAHWRVRPWATVAGRDSAVPVRP